jgi:ParB family chromosome partitioning protein
VSSKLKKLGTLADVYQSEKLDGTITRIRMERLHPSEDQPRQDRMVGIEELSASIKRDGLLSPLVVTKDGEGYRIIAGERRYHALKRLNSQDAECRIISRKERDYFRIAIIENLQRENLNPVEEALALKRLKAQENYSDADLADIVGKSRNYITEILGIASLPAEALEECRLAGIDNKNFLIQAVQAHKKGYWNDFLVAYKNGQIATVREARNFNHKEGRPTGEPGRAREERSSVDPKFIVNIHGTRVEVQCSTEREAAELRIWILKYRKKG